MIPVFIGGSRAISRLNATIREKLDALMERGHPILVGDANGADKAVQTYLSDRAYCNVTVFCTESCRNNIGGWPVRVIRSDRNVRDYAFYAAKDRAMASEAGCGIMLWDGMSRGTLENVIEILRMGRKVLVYASPTRAFKKLETEADLKELTSALSPRPGRNRQRGRSRSTSPSQLRLG